MPLSDVQVCLMISVYQGHAERSPHSEELNLDVVIQSPDARVLLQSKLVAEEFCIKFRSSNNEPCDSSSVSWLSRVLGSLGRCVSFLHCLEPLVAVALLPAFRLHLS